MFENTTVKLRSKKTAKVLLVSAAAVAGMAALAPAAFASGTSPTVNGCYSTWGSTGTNAHCFNVTETGKYQNHASCDAQPDKTSSWLTIGKGSTVDNWGQLNCTFKVSSSRIQYTT